jgi:hypothetical protein
VRQTLMIIACDKLTNSDQSRQREYKILNNSSLATNTWLVFAVKRRKDIQSELSDCTQFMNVQQGAREVIAMVTANRLQTVSMQYQQIFSCSLQVSHHRMLLVSNHAQNHENVYPKRTDVEIKKKNRCPSSEHQRNATKRATLTQFFHNFSPRLIEISQLRVQG